MSTFEDLLVLLQVPRSAASAPDLDSKLSAIATAAYVAARILEAMHEAYDQQISFKALGAEVEADKGSVGTPLEFSRDLWRVISVMLYFGYANQKLYQTLLVP